MEGTSLSFKLHRYVSGEIDLSREELFNALAKEHYDNLKILALMKEYKEKHDKNVSVVKPTSHKHHCHDCNRDHFEPWIYGLGAIAVFFLLALWLFP